VNGDRVHLKVKPEVSTLDYGNAVTLNGFRIPALSTRRAETELELRSGQTFAVAGLMNNQVASTLQKVPGIGDIPIIGHLFRSRAAQKEQTELVVMITPEILPNDSDGVSSTLPRTPDTFLAPLPERRTHTPLPPAFTPDRRSTVSVPQPSRAAEIEQKDQKDRGEAERDRLAAEARAEADATREQQQQEERANAAAARLAADEAKQVEAAAKVAARAAEAEAKRQKADQKRLEKEAREREKKEREAAGRAARNGGPQASTRQADEAAAARASNPAALQQGDAVQQAVDNAAQAQSEDEQRAKAIAEAKLRALEAAAQSPAQVEK
jgi:hypothetical protein